MTGRRCRRRKKPPDEKDHLFLQLLPFLIVILVVKKNLLKSIWFFCKAKQPPTRTGSPAVAKKLRHDCRITDPGVEDELVNS